MDEVHHAILRGDLATVKRLVAQDPDCLDLSDFDARTPLILSALAGSLPLVQFFVDEAGAEVDEAVPPDGCSALFYACRDGRVAIAEYLLAKGADPAQRNRYGTTLPMILATHAPSLPQHAHDEDEEEAEEEEEEEGYGVVADASPHAQVMRLLLRVVKGGAAARAALVDARNRNGKTALVMAIERRRPDLAAALLRAGADPFLMPAGVHHLLPLPVSPGLATAADRALAALLEDARQAPERVALLKRARRLADAAHAVEKILAGGTGAAVTDTPPTFPDHPAATAAVAVAPVVDVDPAVLLPKLLAAAPLELRPRLATAAAAGGTPGAAFAQTVAAALPRVGVVGVDGEGEKGGLGLSFKARRLREAVAFVAVDGGLKEELFVELMMMMSHPWFARVWEEEEGEV